MCLRLGHLGLGKSYQHSLLELSWAILAASWAILATRGPQERNKTEKPEFRPFLWASILGGFSRHVVAMLGHVALQQRMESTSCELVHQGLHLTGQLGSTWPNLALLETIFHGFSRPCRHQKSIKNHSSSWKPKISKMCTAPSREHYL